MNSGTKGLIIYNGKILLVLRDNKPDIPYPNTWDLIGGGKEENETFEQAGLREIEEEFGIKPKNYTFIGIEDYGDRKAGRFIAILDDKEYNNLKLGNEGQKYSLFTLEETINLVSAPNIKKFLIDNKESLRNIVENNEEINIKNFIL